MPYKQVGPAKNASKDAVINLELINEAAQIGVYLTSPRLVQIQLLANGDLIFERAANLSPEEALIETVLVGPGLKPQQVTLRVLDGEQKLISFTPLADQKPAVPAPATAAKSPQEIATNEELFLNGLHLEQYRHATYEPAPYYQEALRRDPYDSRCNNALGLLLFRRGKFAEAEAYFRKAIERITLRNPNPYDGEAYYNLGLALKMLGRYPEAFDAFYKAVWNAAWQSAGYFELARLACRASRWPEALELVERSLDVNQYHHSARHLRIAILRRMESHQPVREEVARALALDGMNLGVHYERFLLEGSTAYRELMRGSVQSAIEISLDYAHAGLFQEASQLLEEVSGSDPMAAYYLAWYYEQSADRPAADMWLDTARRLSPDFCFPNRIEAVVVLQSAIKRRSDDPCAPYYLGNFWYAHRQYQDAIACWERARVLDDQFPTVHRNLGLAYMNKQHDPEAALASYERAFALDPTDARVFFELDQLRKKNGISPIERLAYLDEYPDLVEQRDDLTIERVSLLNVLGRYEDALDVLSTRTFHPWEGGEGKVTGQYVTSLVELARKHLKAGSYQEAVIYLERAQVFPHHLGEGKLAGTQENHIFYYLGTAYEALGDATRAKSYFAQAATGLADPAPAMYYNDQPPDMIFYQGLALQKLDQPAEAHSVFQRLVDYGLTHLNDEVAIDYFAVSLPDFLVFDEDLNLRNRLHCHYVMMLGYIGLHDYAQAETHFRVVIDAVPDHLGAVIHRHLFQDQSRLN